MKQSLFNVSKGLLVAAAISVTAISGTAQAHADIDYSVPAKLLLLSAFLEPLHQHGARHHYRAPQRSASHRHGRDHRSRHGHHAKSRRHTDSHGRYRDDRRIKRHHRD